MDGGVQIEFSSFFAPVRGDASTGKLKPVDLAAAVEGRGEALRDDGDLEATGLTVATGILGCASVLVSGDSVAGEGISLGFGLGTGGGDFTESFALDD